MLWEITGRQPSNALLLASLWVRPLQHEVDQWGRCPASSQQGGLQAAPVSVFLLTASTVKCHGISVSSTYSDQTRMMLFSTWIAASELLFFFSFLNSRTIFLLFSFCLFAIKGISCFNEHFGQWRKTGQDQNIPSLCGVVFTFWPISFLCSFQCGFSDDKDWTLPFWESR